MSGVLHCRGALVCESALLCLVICFQNQLLHTNRNRAHITPPSCRLHGAQRCQAGRPPRQGAVHRLSWHGAEQQAQRAQPTSGGSKCQPPHGWRRFHSSIGCLAASHCVLCLCLAAVLCKQRFSWVWPGGRQPRGMQGRGPVRSFESELLLVWMLTGAANVPLGCAWRVRKSQAAWASCGQQPSSAPQHAEGCTELNE